jgi:Bacterial Ig-like domain (group 1)
MMPPFRSLLRLFAPVLLLAAAGCDERAPSAPSAGVAPSGLRVVGGDGQHGVVGALLPDEVAVAVVDAGGEPLAGFPVRFAVLSGGGQLSAQTAMSDVRGIARVRWTLGAVAADSQVVEARLEPPLAAAVRLRAHAAPDAPAALALAGGNGAAGAVGGLLADSLAVTVKDRLGNPIVGLEVAWQVAAGGGALSPARGVTGAGGVAKAAWTLGPRVDSAQVALARVAGLDSVAFTANAVTAGVPLQLAKRGGDGQRGAAGGVLADSLGVALRMADGRPVVGALVSWNVPPAAGVVTPVVSRTDANGAASAVWRLGTAPGLVQATATVDSGTLVFTALVGADAPAQAAAVSGGGEGLVGGALADSLAVRVMDRYGNPVPGAEVDWSAGADGSVQPARSAAGADGIARTRWTLGTRVDSVQVAQARVVGLEPVAFTARALTAGVPLQLAKRGGDGQRGAVGSVLADSLSVVLRLPDGRGVAGALVRWSTGEGAGSVAPAESRTDASGAASAQWRIGRTLGLAQATATVDDGTLVFTALAEVDLPAALEIVGGNGATGPVGGVLEDSLAVRLTDRHGNPVTGAAVEWSAVSGGGSVHPARATTDAQGIARARWTLGPSVGAPQIARAALLRVPPVSFSATATTAGVPLQLARRGGDGQRGAVGSILADSLGVVLRLPDGRGVSGAVVRWGTEAGTVTPAESRTDADGAASAQWRVGTTPGLARATATVDDGILVFTALAETDAPAELEIVAGDRATGGVGQVLADSLSVRLTDRHGNPVAGAAVEWAAVSGGGSVDPARATTDAQGIARAQWTLGPSVGAPQLARAAVPGVSSASFLATPTTTGVPLQLARRGGESQRGTAGSYLADSLAVVLRLPDGRGVSGALVRWAADDGSVSPAESRTDDSGAASARWRVGLTPGFTRATAAVDNGRLNFYAVVREPVPAKLEIVAGDGATGGVGQALADSLALRVTDAADNPAIGVRVWWEVLEGGGFVAPAPSTTDTLGIARAQWTLGGRVGASAQAVRVSMWGVPPVVFRATGTTRGIPVRLARVGGNGQSGDGGLTLEDSLSVQLHTPGGVPIEGAPIAWRVLSGGGQISPPLVRTDVQGRARAAWRMGSVAGPASASATVDDSVVVFTATVRTAPPAAVRIVRGDRQSGTRGMPLPDSLVVQVTDASGTPLPNVRVSWSVISGGGHLEQPSSMTGADGRARNRWAVGFNPGSNSVRAATQAGSEARFTATGRPGTLRLAGNSSARVVRELGTQALLEGRVIAYVTDSLGRRAIGAPLRWDVPRHPPFPAPRSEPSPGWAEYSMILLDGHVFFTFDPAYAIVHFEGQRRTLYQADYVPPPDWESLGDASGPNSAGDALSAGAPFKETVSGACTGQPDE